jgi:AraC-like DNA-binding protein
MPATFDHDQVRALAKRLRMRLGRDDIKHTHIIDEMAAVLGLRADALMHRLKHETAPAATASKADPRDEADMISSISELAAESRGFQSGEVLGAEGFWKQLHQERGLNGGMLYAHVYPIPGNHLDTDPNLFVWKAVTVYRNELGLEFVRGSETSEVRLVTALRAAEAMRDSAVARFDKLHDAPALAAARAGLVNATYEDTKRTVLDAFA